MVMTQSLDHCHSLHATGLDHFSAAKKALITLKH